VLVPFALFPRGDQRLEATHEIGVLGARHVPGVMVGVSAVFGGVIILLALVVQPPILGWRLSDGLRDAPCARAGFFRDIDDANVEAALRAEIEEIREALVTNELEATELRRARGGKAEVRIGPDTELLVPEVRVHEERVQVIVAQPEASLDRGVQIGQRARRRDLDRAVDVEIRPRDDAQV